MKALIFSVTILATAAFGQDIPPPGLTTQERLEWIRRHPPASQRRQTPPPQQRQTPPQRPPLPSRAPPPMTNAPAITMLPRPVTMYVKPPTETGKSATVFDKVGFNYITCPRDRRCGRIDWIERDEPVQVYATTCGDFNNPGTGFSCDSAQGERYFQVHVKDEDGNVVIGYIQASYLTLEKPKGEEPPEPPKQEAGIPDCKDCEDKTKPVDSRREEEARRLKEAAEKRAREEAARRAREAARSATPGSLGPGPVPDMGDTQKINVRCQSLINEDGVLGDWGETLKASAEEVGIDCFMTPQKWAPVCPKFNTFNAEKKMQLLAFAFAARAQHESSCDPDEETNGIITEDLHYHPGAPTRKKVTGKGKKRREFTVYLVQQRAVGLFQLEKSAHRRADMNRGPFCETNDTKNIDFQFKCSLATMKRVMCEWGGDYTSPDGYWQEELSPKRKISKMIARFPGCK